MSDEGNTSIITAGRQGTLVSGGGEQYEIERIVDKRFRNGRLEYLIKWRDYPESQNTWEPASNIEPDEERELLSEYEATTKPTGSLKPSPSQKFPPYGSVKDFRLKRKNDDVLGGKKIVGEKPSGFDRGYEPEKILGATDSTGELMLLVKWRGSDEADLVPSRIANVKCPDLVIEFYEQHSFWIKLPRKMQTR
ncbi:unnamed protein product [Didymodactylos carnosus]|uniref:Chromo domain-containing protein n=1 Tax=Didymodactylos carnosus TaxID=1234261 RepID=A0A814IJG9_9BILA|nr:unnamed protein product [Didymodactylos carnosus]CAF1026793.1 unnamed protein product [Didymodactylos carnosus]CAF3593099.1 unnamed protein product [Didymodactylos carnosus]CAF3797894.1 unnamed protein product [Didymodactylos carnosus]